MPHQALRILLLIMLLSSLLGQGQDTLRLLNGKVLDVKIQDFSGTEVVFTAQKKNGKWKELAVHRSEVFSLQKKGEADSILYFQDVAFGNDLTLDQMRFYMAGQADARNGYNPWPSTIGGTAFGMATVFYLEGGYVPFTSPFVYGFSMQIPYIKIREKSMSDLRYKVSDSYVDGYNKTARSKKLLHNIVGTFAGVALGSILFELRD